jgi:hypothetical protein
VYALERTRKRGGEKKEGWGGDVGMSEIKKKEARTIRVGVQVRKT